MGGGRDPLGQLLPRVMCLGPPVAYRSPRPAQNPETALAALSVDGLSGVWTSGGGGPTANVPGDLVP